LVRRAEVGVHYVSICVFAGSAAVCLAAAK
jgi:hypothetical protein